MPVRRTQYLTQRFRPHTASSQSPPHSRYFAQNVAHQHIVSHGVPRPQLPFLYSPSRRVVQRQRLRSHGGQWQVARYVSTENRIWLKQQVKLGVKYGLYGWAILACLTVAGFGWEHEQLERMFPSPPEWSWITRMHFRHGHKQEDAKINANQIIDWAMASSAYEQALQRLENLNGEGKGLVLQVGESVPFEGVGTTGFDISAKSEPWRRGYWETLMGCGRAAQHLDGWVKDETRSISFPVELMIGPSNPNPRPCPPNSHPAPLEENCVPAFPPPETFYTKILTTKGFTTRQRMQAALAYGDWLDFKGLRESAEEMYRWALDIAASGVLDASVIIDTKTGIIRESAIGVTSNILEAATSLAIHFAQHSGLSSALPIYLSVLRARRSAPVRIEASASTGSSSSGVVSAILSLLKSPDYPPAPPTGDEMLTRDNESRCEDAVVMMYIGEVLFVASATQRDAGLRWTREAVEIAEEAVEEESMGSDMQGKCSECATMGLRNWLSMLRELMKEQQQDAESPRQGDWKSWIGLGQNKISSRISWEEEERAVESRLAVYRERQLREQYGANRMFLPALGK